ncbi:MAG: cytochrome b N-terminal domain-containing protein [Armatimonadota bacterium]|nr:cytochrome b N-terminal domain-containing protein [Armatimonadota bacterium]
MRTILKWIDEQTDLITGVLKFMAEPLPAKVGWPHIAGSLVLFFFTLQVATGILLMAYYSPSPDHAYETVQFISYKLPLGGLVRGLHHWGASAMVIALGIHLLQVFLWGAYKKPRQIIWVIGIGLMMVTFTFSFTGYLLPWDQKAYWATVVGTNIAGSVPYIGNIIREIMRGGSAVGAVTLTRFFALHVGILPPIISALILFHILQVRKKGITPPGRAVGDEAGVPHTQAFWPHQVLKDAIAALVALVVVGGLAIKFGAPIEPLANPADTAYIPRPEWYFLWMFDLLRYFPGNLEFVGAVLVPSLAILLLAIYPYLDTNPERMLRRRKLAAGLCFGVLAGISVLGIHAIVTSPKEKELTALEQRGQKVFFDLRCNACHGINGGGGNAGPDLALAGPWKRDALEGLLLTPTKFRPRSIMPPTNIPRDKMDALMTYLIALTPTSRLPFQPQIGPRKPPTHFTGTWYIDHKYEVRKDPSQCAKCHEPAFCQTCHHNRRPDSHLRQWLKFHPGAAQEKPEYCRVCHAQDFCASCHNKLLHTSDWLRQKHGPASTAQPGVCDECHRREMCVTCHAGTPPSSHMKNWRIKHGPVALQSTAGCNACHTQQSCDSCHKTLMPHKSDWRSKHGQAAISTPAMCEQCHTFSRRGCRKCHAAMKPSFHKGTFRGNHKEMAASRPSLCPLCHGRNGCMDCHKTPMPHAKDWIGTHGSKGASFKKGAFCFNCHSKEKCQMCHGEVGKDG